MERLARAGMAGLVGALLASPSVAHAVPTIQVSHSSAGVTLRAGETRTVDAPCVKGARAIWGYVDLGGEAGLDVVKQGPQPPSNATAWRATVRNTGTATRSLDVGASCQRGTEGMGLTANTRGNARAAGGSRGLHYTQPLTKNVGALDGDDSDVVTVICPQPTVLADVWIESAGGADVVIDAWELRDEGGILDIEIKNKADAKSGRIVLKYRCKKVSGGLQLDARGGSVSPKRIEIVERNGTTKAKVSGAGRAAGLGGTVQLKCPVKNSVIESAHVFAGNGRVVEEGPLDGIGGWRARLEGVRSGDEVGVTVVCLQSGAAVKIVRVPGLRRIVGRSASPLCRPFRALGGCRSAAP